MEEMVRQFKANQGVFKKMYLLMITLIGTSDIQ